MVVVINKIDSDGVNCGGNDNKVPKTNYHGSRIIQR